MRVSLGTIDIGDEQRRALAQRIGKSGLATRDDVRSFALTSFLGDLENVCHDMEQDEKEQRRKRADQEGR